MVRKHLNRSERNKVALQVRRVLGELRELLDQGAASEIVNLAEFAVERISKIVWRLDYGSDVSADLLVEAQQLHITACEQEPPDQTSLAAALFEWTTSGPDTRFISYEAYSAILGEPGRETFRRLTEAEWDKFPVLKPSKNSYYFHYEDTGIRQRLTDLLKEMARADGDTDRLVEVCRKDISSPSNYLEIAEILEDAGRIDEAIEWVRQSVETFPGRDVMRSQHSARETSSTSGPRRGSDGRDLEVVRGRSRRAVVCEGDGESPRRRPRSGVSREGPSVCPSDHCGRRVGPRAQALETYPLRRVQIAGRPQSSSRNFYA